ncbi:MAG: PIN domain-containing protein [Candidatus Competibacteraceae bacterium]|jgi:predicted nucleic acid-binding protein|nr:PIN domain-containing protein [Candidatus Competibacteraceae bacterium]NJN48233.1 PIN domain-containing protein [Candidatus Competibacteraceae bacterium]
MNANEPFFDTNILLYLLSSDAAKADRAEQLMATGGVISVQVLNEFATVASRKLGMSWREIREVLDTVRAICRVMPLTLETHDRGMALSERYGFALYDAMILAAALLANCMILYTEDLQDGQRIDNQLTVNNPFNPP